MNNFLIVIVVLVLLAILVWLWLRLRGARSGNYQFTPADFDPRDIISLDLDGLQVRVGPGSLTNNLGQTLLINVVASADRSVIEYFNMAKFHFEIREPTDIPITPERPQQVSSKLSDLPVQPDLEERLEQTSSKQLMPNEEAKQEPPKFSVQKLLKENNENLSVYFDLAPETIQKYPRGDMFVAIDPPLHQNRRHNYAARDAPGRVSVTLIHRGGGDKVTGSLYVRCREHKTQSASGRGQVVLRGPRVPDNEINDYDFTVLGGTGINQYELQGLFGGVSYTEAAAAVRGITPARINGCQPR
jgi:hypothetical protein